MILFLKNRFQLKYILAVLIGSFLFYILGAMVSIPIGKYNVYVSMQYGLLGFLSVVYGPIVGVLVGFIGHFFIDFSENWIIGEVWWGWVTGSAAVGLVIGLIMRKVDINQGAFDTKKMLRFAVASFIANLIAWEIIAPGLDVLIYHEDFVVTIVQGILSSVCNIITTIVVGLILCFVYYIAISGKDESEGSAQEN